MSYINYTDEGCGGYVPDHTWKDFLMAIGIFGFLILISLLWVYIFVDWDCIDFSTQEDAQSFFEHRLGKIYDYHHLDGDADGIACESLR